MSEVTPKWSPGRIIRRRAWVPSSQWRWTINSPLRTMYIDLPLSPSANTCSPAATVRSVRRDATASTTSGARPPKKDVVLRNAARSPSGMPDSRAISGGGVYLRLEPRPDRLCHVWHQAQAGPGLDGGGADLERAPVGRPGNARIVRHDHRD